MIHRLLKIPFPPDKFREEVDTIRSIALQNDIHLNIEKHIHHIRLSQIHSRTTSLASSTSLTRTRWVRLPYLGHVSYKIAKVLRTLGLNPGFYPMRTLRSLSFIKDPVPIQAKTGVYKVTCRDCGSSYIGQTGRSISVRLKEHLDAWEKNDRHKSSVARHLLDSRHNPLNLDIKLLHHVEKSFFPQQSGTIRDRPNGEHGTWSTTQWC